MICKYIRRCSALRESAIIGCGNCKTRHFRGTVVLWRWSKGIWSHEICSLKGNHISIREYMRERAGKNCSLLLSCHARFTSSILRRVILSDREIGIKVCLYFVHQIRLRNSTSLLLPQIQTTVVEEKYDCHWMRLQRSVNVQEMRLVAYVWQRHLTADR